MSGLHIGRLSRWRKWYLNLRIWLGLRFVEQPAPPHHQLPRPPVYNIGFGQTFKLESSLNEIVAMEFIRERTSIPVPKVYAAWHQTDGNQLVTKADGLRTMSHVTFS